MYRGQPQLTWYRTIQQAGCLDLDQETRRFELGMLRSCPPAAPVRGRNAYPAHHFFLDT